MARDACLLQHPVAELLHLGPRLADRRHGQPVEIRAAHAPRVAERLDQLATLQGLEHQRDSRQRHTMTGERGLHLLVGEVQVQPALGLEARMILQGQPAPPTQELGTGLGVVLFGQCVLHEIGRRAERRRLAAADLLHQRAAHDRRQHLAEQPHRALWRLRRAAIAERQIELGVVEVGDRVGGRDADVDVRVLALERLDARQQPQRAERCEGRHTDALAAARLADLAHARVDLAEAALDRTLQHAAALRQLHVPRAAHEQRGAELALQPLDLSTDGRLGDEQFLGRVAEVQAPRDRFESAQAAEREGATGSRIHIKSASMAGAGFIGLPRQQRRS